MMKRKASKPQSSFDPSQVKSQFEALLPKIITEFADLFEQPTPRLSKRDKRRMLADFSRGIDASAPHVKVLEEINGDPARFLESYQNVEQIFRKQFQIAKIRMRPGEDAFDSFVRQSERLLRAPYRVKRLKQFALVRQGVQTLVRNAMAAPGGLKSSEVLIQEFNRKHLKEYLRFANTLDMRLKSHSNVDLTKPTAKNITRIADVYRDAASAFENRLRELVGLNFIALGQAKTYSEIRGFGYNQLLQAADRRKTLCFIS